MTLFLSILILVICSYLYKKSKQDKADSEFEEINNKANSSIKPNSRENVIKALEELGCQPHIDKDYINVAYQGETFNIQADDDYSNITIYDPWWGGYSLDDKNIESVKEAVNLCNINNCIPTMMYTINEAENQIGLHCRLNLNFIDNEGKYSLLLAAYFKTFFDAHEMYGKILYNRINTKHESEKKLRTVIKGFSQDKEDR